MPREEIKVESDKGYEPVGSGADVLLMFVAIAGIVFMLYLWSR